MQRGELQHALESVKSEASTATMHAQQREAELSANLALSRRFAPTLSPLCSLRTDASVRLHERMPMHLRPIICTPQRHVGLVRLTVSEPAAFSCREHRPHGSAGIGRLDTG